MKTKKVIIALIILIVVLAAFAFGWFFATRQNQKEQENIGMIQLNCEDQTYQPVIGGKYDLRNEDGTIKNVEVGVDGTVKFYEVPAGKYTLVSTSIPEGYELPYPETEIEIKKGQKITVTKTYKRIVPRLVLTVEDEDGNPLENAKIELYDEEEYILPIIDIEEIIDKCRELDIVFLLKDFSEEFEGREINIFNKFLFSLSYLFFQEENTNPPTWFLKGWIEFLKYFRKLLIGKNYRN